MSRKKRVTEPWRVEPPKDILTCLYSGHLLLYRKRSRRLFILNETAQILWELLQQENGIISISKRFSEISDIPMELAIRDVSVCLKDWHRNELLISNCSSGQKHEDFSCQKPIRSPELPPAILPEIHYYKEFLLANIRVRLGFGDISLLDTLISILGHLLICTESDPDLEICIYKNKQQYHIAINGLLAYEVANQDEVIFKVVYELVEQTYNDWDCMAVIHGGAVACGDQCIVFPGSQRSGKSTLVAALQSAGFIYLADDVCPITTEQLIPVPMSQALKQGSWEVLKEYRPELQGKTVRRRLNSDVCYLPPINKNRSAWDHPWPVSVFIFPKYDPDGEFCCNRLSPIESLHRLISSDSVFSERLPDLLAWVESIPAYSLNYQDLKQAIVTVQQLFSSRWTTR